MSIDIKPCPFCDHADVEICEVQPGTIAIDCPECECIGPFASTVEAAVEKWNRPHERDFKMDRLVREARERKAPENVAVEGASAARREAPSRTEGSAS